MERVTTGAACGKAILLGEHAVVYGVPALVAGIDRGARARVTSLGRGPSELVLGDSIRVTSDEDGDLSRALRAVVDASNVGAPVRLELTTDLPAAAGLGCSAALGVAAARALDAFAGGEAGPDAIAARALAWEAVFHGNASGVDAAAAARGGCLLFTRGAEGPALEPVAIGSALVLAIGHTGIPSSTRAMVDGLARLRERAPAMVDKSFEGIRTLVRNARLAIEAGDLTAVGRYFDLNQMLLSGLMLSTEEIETMCRVAREAGALGAKLTGAGGGGCVIALAPGDPAPILAAWKRAGFDGFATTVQRPRASGARPAEAP